MRITAKGQVTIPQPIRETAGLLPNTEVVFAIEHGKVTISKARAGRPTRGKKVVALLREHGGRRRLSTDEIMALTRGD